MKFVLWILGVVLAALLSVATTTYVMDKTFFDSGYVQSKLAKSGLYTQLSAAVPKRLVGNLPDGPQKDALRQKIGEIITPGYVETKLGGTITQIEKFYKQGGAVPTVDFRDFVAQANQAGIPISDKDFAKSLEVVSPDGEVIQQGYTSYKRYQPWLYAATFVVFLLLVGLSIAWHHFNSLTSALMSAFFANLLAAITFWYGPEQLLRYVPLNQPTIQEFLPTVQLIVTSIGQDVGRIYGYMAVVILCTFIPFYIAAFRANRKRKAEEQAALPKKAAATTV